MLYCFTELSETFWFIIEHYFMCINNYKVLNDELTELENMSETKQK